MLKVTKVCLLLIASFVTRLWGLLLHNLRHSLLVLKFRNTFVLYVQTCIELTRSRRDIGRQIITRT